MVGLTSRFSGRAKNANLPQANVYVQEARRLFKLDIDNVCLENIQSGILILNSCLAESRPELESLYFSLIVRQAQLLNLGVDHPQDDEITREVKKRIWWSLYMIDRWTSGGINLPRLLNFSPVNSPLALPMNELIFRDWGTHKNEENVHFQSWAQMIKLVYIYGHIQDLNNELVNGTMLFHEQHKIKESVLDLSKQLDRWYESLPQEMRFTESNLVIYQEKNIARCFVALHLGYFHYSTLLYFQFLDVQQPSTPTRLEFAKRCTHYAMWTSYIVASTITKPGCEPLYNAVGHMTVVSSSVLLHQLLFGELGQAQRARECLESNFRTLMILKKYWPSVDIMIERLRIFQNACRLLMGEAYKMDRWMLKFLLQYAMTLEEKTDADDMIQIQATKNFSITEQEDSIIDNLLKLLSTS